VHRTVGARPDAKIARVMIQFVRHPRIRSYHPKSVVRCGQMNGHKAHYPTSQV
jgi:hypothetical protein